MAAGTSSFGGLVADNFPTGVGAIFNLTGSGSVVSSAVASGTDSTVISTSIQRVGTTELYRCSITFSFTSITSVAVGFGVSNGSTYAFSIFPSASSGTVNAGAVQLERSSTARAYIPTTTAAVYGPRFDHDPVTLACKGLLIEEGRTNLLARSAEFNQFPWSSSLATITQDDGVSPDGLTTAESFLFTGTGSIVQTAVMGSTAPTATFSLFVKAKTGTGFARIIVGNGTSPSNLFGGWFNLSTGLWGTTGITNSATLVGTSVTNFNNGWYRISITGSVSGASSYTPFLYITDSDNSIVRSTTVSQLWWGAQLEAGSFPTSYIPTTTGSVARSTDVCDITGGDFDGFYNQSEGTAVIKFTNADTSGYPQIFAFNQTAAPFANRIYVVGYNRMQNTEVGIVTSSVGQLAYVGSLTSKAGNLSLSYKLNDAAYAKDGVIAATDNTVTLGTFIDRLQFQETNGCIASFRYFKKRLPNAKLVTLTV
jgi:hypothetical protein